MTTATEDAEAEAAAQEEILVYEDAPHMRFTVECPDVPVSAAQDMARLCEADPQINNSYMDLAGYVMEVATEPTTYTVTAADGSEATVTDPSTCTVIFVVEGYFDEAAATKNMAYALGQQELRIGKGYVVKTKSIEVAGTVIAMEVVNE